MNVIKYKKDNNKLIVVLVEDRLIYPVDTLSVAKFAQEFLRSKADRYPFYVSFYDREFDFNRSDAGFTLAMASQKGVHDKTEIQVRTRTDYEKPSDIDLTIYDEWCRLIDSDIKLGPGTMDDAMYTSGVEYERKRKALAGDKFGIAYEDADRAIFESTLFLYNSQCDEFNI